MVEIAKALSIDARILIMDEPTSSLSSHEAEQLFRVIKDLRDSGVSVIYISHRLGEVTELADRVAVLRDGENAGELPRAEVNHDNMVRLMVGRDVSQFYARQQHEIGDVVLAVENLVTPTWPQHALSFSVRRGEIVGVAGLVGAGRTEMLRTLFGIDRPIRGTVQLNGKPITLESPVDAIRAGMAAGPRRPQAARIDRRHGGACEYRFGWTTIQATPIRVLNQTAETADTTEMIRKLRIKTPTAEQIARYLSGGNQQKVVLGKWLALGPSLLLLDEPTRDRCRSETRDLSLDGRVGRAGHVDPVRFQRTGRDTRHERPYDRHARGADHGRTHTRSTERGSHHATRHGNCSSGLSPRKRV